MKRRNAALTDAQRPSAVLEHVDGDAVVVHARRHRVDAGEFGILAAAVVVIATISHFARTLATLRQQKKQVNNIRI